MNGYQKAVSKDPPRQPSILLIAKPLHLALDHLAGGLRGDVAQHGNFVMGGLAASGGQPVTAAT